MGTFRTSGGNSIAQTEYADMIIEANDAIPFRINIMTCVFMYIILAGFLVLPSSFPTIETDVEGSNKLSQVVHFARNVPLYVPFFPLVPLFKPKKWSLRP